MDWLDQAHLPEPDVVAISLFFKSRVYYVFSWEVKYKDFTI